MPKQEKIAFQKISVKEDVKREIDILAAMEGRHVYEVVADAMKVYKQVVIGKKPSPKGKAVSVVDVISK